MHPSVARQPKPDLNVVLINPYEIGRQPFGLAEPAAWLTRAGCTVQCLDLTLQRLEPDVLRDAHMVAVYVAMHTATRIAMEAIPRVRELAPNAHLCVYGLYAPMNEQRLRELGVQSVFGGEVEPQLVSLIERLRAGNGAAQTEPVINLSKIDFRVPDRSALPPLSRYAHLQLPDGSQKTVGFAEATRGCKHLCRHCPVVPVYQGAFRVIPVDTVLADIRNQVASGAEHISFGDPDFLNGPTHALKVVQALHSEFPKLTYDATIKIQHILNHEDLLPELKATGCLFITSAAESVDDAVLIRLAKNHTNADFARAVDLCRRHHIALAPTFVAFTPWTTLEGYIALLQRLLELHLIESVPPIQLALRLLIPQGSLLLELTDVKTLIGVFDPNLLGYPWKNPDARVDHLQQSIQSLVMQAETEKRSRREIFVAIWKLVHDAMGDAAPALNFSDTDTSIPRLSEPWYCCAEPTQQQLQSF